MPNADVMRKAILHRALSQAPCGLGSVTESVEQLRADANDR